MINADPIPTLLKLIEVDLHGMTHIARCFYVWSLNDMIDESLPLTDQVLLKGEIMDLTKMWNCGLILDEVPIIFTDALQPITGKIGMRGGQSALNTLIGEYAARSPNRLDIIERLTNVT